MPSVVRKQNDEAPSHDTISCVRDEVVNSSAERLLVANENGSVSVVSLSHIAAGEVASLGVEASSGLWPTEASGTAYSASCRATQSCVAASNGLDWKPGHSDLADIEMAEICTVADDAHAYEHSKNTEYNSMDDVKFHCDTGDRDYRLRSNFPRSPYLPRGEPHGYGDTINGHQEPVQDDCCPSKSRCAQRPYGNDSTAIDMSGIDEPSESDEPITEQQQPKDAVPVIIGADGAGTSQDESNVNHDAGMSNHIPKAKHQRKLPSHLPFLVSADGKSISDLLQLRPIRPSTSGIELFANPSESHAKGKRQESEQARLARKLEERKAKREYKLPVAQSIPGYVGDKGVDFCLSYVTGCKPDLNGESFDKVNDGGRLKHKKKRKANTSVSSSPEEWSSSESHPSANTAPCASNGHRLATVGTADARASASAPNARSTKEGTVADTSRPASTGGHSSITAIAADDAFQVVDRKKKVKNLVSLTGCQSLRLPVPGLPARNVLSSTLPLGSTASIVASNCPDDERSEGDGDSSPSSCTLQPVGSSEMDAGDGCIFLGSLLQQPTAASGPSVPAKAEPPKATWAAVAAAGSRVRDSAAAVACHSASANDQSSGPQKTVAGDDATSNESGDGSSPRGDATAAATVEEAAVASREAAGYQPPAAGLPETVVQSSSIVSWPNAVVNPGILADSSQMRSTPPEQVRPVDEEAARVAEASASTSTAKLAPAAAAASHNAPASGRIIDASIALPEASLQRCKGVEFVGNQWREFFSRDSSRRIAFGFHDPLSSSSSIAAAETDDMGGMLQVSLNESAAGRPSEDSRTLAGSNLASTVCLEASVPAAVPAEEDVAAAAAVCTPASICGSRTLGYELPANAEPRRSPVQFTFGVAASLANIDTSECPSAFSAVHVANVTYLSAGWLAVQELLVKDASRVQVYDGNLERKKPGSVAETDNVRSA